MLTTQSIFERYEEVRARLPRAHTTEGLQDIGSLTEIADQASAFVFDAFGVLNVGETLIEGADVRIRELRARGCAIRILTNAASYDRAGAVAKFKALGIEVFDDEIITSRDATLDVLDDRTWGVIAAPEDAISDVPATPVRLQDTMQDYDRVDGFVFLSTTGWTEARQEMLTASLLRDPRPVLIANADLAAPRDAGFSLEPGHYGHLLADQGAGNVRFFGKPFPEVYDLLERSLADIPPERIVMCGDTLHTDILGAAARGWKTVLVTEDGLFARHDTAPFCHDASLFPTWRVARI